MREQKRKAIITLSFVILACSVIWLALSILCYYNRLYGKRDAVTDKCCLLEFFETDHPMSEYEESERIAQAVIDTIGTDDECRTFGYSFTELMEIITQEGITYDQCHACATALFNACVKCNGRYDPVEMARIQQFESPDRYYTEAAKRACIDVFVRGNFCETVEDATAFHSLGRGNTKYHDGERCEWVCNYEGIDFYRELKDWSVV